MGELAKLFVALVAKEIYDAAKSGVRSAAKAIGRKLRTAKAGKLPSNRAGPPEMKRR